MVEFAKPNLSGPCAAHSFWGGCEPWTRLSSYAHLTAPAHDRLPASANLGTDLDRLRDRENRRNGKRRQAQSRQRCGGRQRRPPGEATESAGMCSPRGVVCIVGGGSERREPRWLPCGKAPGWARDDRVRPAALLTSAGPAATPAPPTMHAVTEKTMCRASGRAC